MPGSPATSPRFGAPRFAQGDDANFTADVNPIVDAFDTAAKLSELDLEITRAEAAELAEQTRAEAAEAAEAAARIAFDDGEVAARIAGDGFQVVHVACWPSDTPPTTPSGVVVGMVPAPVVAGQTYDLVGIASRCAVVGATPSVFAVQSDNGHGDGSLANVGGLTAIAPAAGRFAEVDATAALALNRLDAVAIKCVTQGNSLGVALALLFGRTAP